MRHLSWALNAAGVSTALWAWLRPVPYVLALSVCALVPIAAVALLSRYPGALTLERARDGRPHLGMAFFLPPLAVGLRGMDFHVVGWPWLLGIGVCLSAAFATRAVWSDGTGAGRLRRAGIYTFLLVGYGPGVLAMANAFLDFHPNQAFEVEVVDKTIRHGKYTSYHFYLAPWGPFTDADDVKVPKAFYAQTERDDRVSVTWHPGALGFGWFELAPRL